eukprot:1137293-Pyramimonas_sp.AAC.1
MMPDEKVTRIQEPDQLRGYAMCLRVSTERGLMHIIVNVYLPPPKNACEMEGERPPRQRSDSTYLERRSHGLTKRAQARHTGDNGRGLQRDMAVPQRQAQGGNTVRTSGLLGVYSLLI